MCVCLKIAKISVEWVPSVFAGSLETKSNQSLVKLVSLLVPSTLFWSVCLWLMFPHTDLCLHAVSSASSVTMETSYCSEPTYSISGILGIRKCSSKHEEGVCSIFVHAWEAEFLLANFYINLNTVTISVIFANYQNFTALLHSVLYLGNLRSIYSLYCVVIVNDTRRE